MGFLFRTGSTAKRPAISISSRFRESDYYVWFHRRAASVPSARLFPQPTPLVVISNIPPIACPIPRTQSDRISRHDSLDVANQLFVNTEGIPGVTPRTNLFGIDYPAVFWIRDAGDCQFRMVADDGATP